jgi:F-type H+-transporting ATPase subunit b
MNRIIGTSEISTAARRLISVGAFAASAAILIIAGNSTAHAGEHDGAETRAAGAAAGEPAHAARTGHGESASDGTGKAASDTHTSNANHGAAGHATGEHATGEHATGEHGEAGGHDEPKMNWSDFSNTKQPPYLALLLNFAVLIGLFYYFGKDKIAAGLRDRKTTIAKDIEEAARMKAAAAERAEKYQTSLKNLDKDQATTKAALEAAGKKERDVLIANAEEKAARMQRDAEFILAQERKQTRLDILRATVERASDSAESLLHTNANADDHERMVTLFLTELAGRPASGAATTVTAKETT